jgi:aspartokinase-like uncharacterized kinase
MWVAKIGGSLSQQVTLAPWLAALAGDPGRRWLCVPGGGPYADAVRAAQQREGFSDAEAHVRAMLAMARYGEDLQRLEPRLQGCVSIAACAAPGGGWPRLWCPAAADAAVLAELPADWRVSADSLAHALATHLKATGLVLLKSVPPPPAATAAALAAAGYVDAWLPTLMQASPLPVYWAVAADLPPLALTPSLWPPASQRVPD